MSPYATTKGSRVRMLGIPLKANVFATLQPRPLRTPCTDNSTKKFPRIRNRKYLKLRFDVDIGYRREEIQDEYEASGSDLLIVD
jgi:hypothetical protein